MRPAVLVMKVGASPQESDSESREPSRERDKTGRRTRTRDRDKGPMESARDRKVGLDNSERTSASRSERARDSLAGVPDLDDQSQPEDTRIVRFESRDGGCRGSGNRLVFSMHGEEPGHRPTPRTTRLHPCVHWEGLDDGCQRMNTGESGGELTRCEDERCTSRPSEVARRRGQRSHPALL